MAGADKIVFHVLDVGQGNGNFIGVYEGGNFTSSILIDLGADGTQRWGKSAVTFIQAQLNTMTTPTIDTIILSHSDSDHHSLINRLLSHFSPDGSGGKPKLIIKQVYYGGPRCEYRGRGNSPNTLTALAKYCGNDAIYTYPKHYCSYMSLKDTNSISIESNVFLDFLSINTPCSAANQSNHALNTFSAVVVLTFFGVQYVITGDATGTTMMNCNDFIFRASIHDKGFLNNVCMMTVPHHGSAVTAFEFMPVDDSPLDVVTNVRNFVKNINAKSITVSAGRSTNHNHPSAYLLSFFWYPTAGKPMFVDSSIDSGDAKLHYYTAFFDSGKNPVTLEHMSFKVTSPTCTGTFPVMGSHGWMTLQTGFNVYSTDYCETSSWVKTENFWNSINSDLVLSNHADHTLVLPPRLGGQSSKINLTSLPPEHLIWHYTTDNSGSTVLICSQNLPSLQVFGGKATVPITHKTPSPVNSTNTKPYLSIDKLKIVI